MLSVFLTLWTDLAELATIVNCRCIFHIFMSKRKNRLKFLYIIGLTWISYQKWTWKNCQFCLLSMLFQVKIGKSTHKWMCVRKNNVNVSYTWYRPLPFGVFKFVFVASSDLGKPVGNLPFTTQKEFVELTSFVLIIN